MLALVLSVVLTGCAMARGFYADEISSEDFDVGQEVIPEVEIVPAEEYEEWVEEKLDSGELVDLTGEDGFHAYGSIGGEVIANQEEINKAEDLLKSLGLLN